MDRIIEHSLFAATLLLMLLSVVCHAEPLTERFIVELEKNAVFHNQSFSMKSDQCTLLRDPSNIANTDDCAGPDSQPDDKPRKAGGNRAKSTIIESISWDLLYTTHLLAGCVMILTTRDAPLCLNPFLWIPPGEVTTIGWLLKSRWNPDSPSFSSVEKPIEQQEVSQSHTFATITMMYGFGEDSQQNQPSKSSVQETTTVSPYPGESFNHLRYSDSDGGDAGPQQHSHTLGLNCFVHPCHGVCDLRESSESKEPAEWSMNCGQSSCSHLANGLCFSCMGHFVPLNSTHCQQIPPLKIWDDIPAIMSQYDSGQLFRQQPHSIDVNPTNSISSVERVASDGVVSDSVSAEAISRSDATGQSTCNVIVVWEDGQLRPCGKVSRNVQALSVHKSKYHTGQKVCDVLVDGADGQQQPCRKICINAATLWNHKRSVHTIQQTCDATVVGQDGLLRSCGKLYSNIRALWNHKRSTHGGQRICNVKVTGENGRLQLCRAVCKSSKALSVHKSKVHSGQRTCDVTVIGEHGQLQPCGKVCKSAKALSDHKSGYHTGKKTCDVTVVGDDGQQRPCAAVCKHARALSTHKSVTHIRQRTCDETIVGEDSQQRLCGKICRSAQVLSEHKRMHRKRIPVGADEDDDLSP
ncbi:hypothetical protein [Endozoicomonas sp. ISHI1]|uniref:hypothetical protein n=2 Tax=unclassified Endozoicomonas TaxID=2644528 RepID=UPI002148DEB6|nr:hypothetical protein [Endozoicomonas sp. ISHI1]